MNTPFAAFKRGRSPEKFFGFRSTDKNSISELQNQLTFPQLCEVVDRNSLTIDRFHSRIFYGNPLPKSYQDLGKVEKRFWPFYSATLIHSINWTTLCIRRHKWHISLFIEYRKIFENAFLIGDYEEAEKYLTKIENEVCHSLWSLENRMLLHEFKDSPEHNKTFLSETNKTATGVFTASLAHYLSTRSERNLAVSRFDSDLNIALQKIKGNDAEGHRELYYLRLNRFTYDNYINLKDVLTFDSHNSVIDRYVLLVQLLKMSLSAENIDPATKFFVADRLKYLSNKFLDPSLVSVNALLSKKFTPKSETDVDLSLIDLFTSGLYNECLERLTTKLTQAPSIIEYYVLYVKCFLYSDTSFSLPSTTSCHQNSILETIYQLLARSVDPNEALINLQRSLKNLHSFTIADGIHKFINDETKSNSKWSHFDFMSLSQNNPEIVGFFGDPAVQLTYLKKVLQNYPHSITVKFKLTSFDIQYERLLEGLNIPEIIKKVELGKLLHAKGIYDQAVNLWLEVIDDANSIIPIHELAIEYLFMSYVKLSSFNKAISLYVDTYLKSNFLISRIDLSSIHTRIREKKFRNVVSSIDLPLFYTFTKSDENEVHIAYEKLLNTFNVNRPSQLKADVFSVNTMKWVLFLRYTCSTDTFKHSIHIDGSKDGYSERINVCQVLLFLDKENEQHYKNEIKELSDALIIQEGLQQLDESKIYVNESGLVNFELKEFEGLFNRYRTIANIYKTQKKDALLIFDRRRNNVRLASIDDVVDALTNDQYSSDPLRDAFADIFDVITRKFLFSKFGISAYLSTRIRHGVLLGELRPIFEKSNLIAQRDSHTGDYLPIAHWAKKYQQLTEENSKSMQGSLAKFSEQIDSIILGLLKDSLQIRTEDEHEEGWFDYYFDDTNLSLHAVAARESRDFSEFVRRTLEILWQRTDTNLYKIRNKIQNEVKAKFNQAIETLTSDLQTALHGSSPIFTNINTCLTETDITLNRIASWFNRSGSQTSDFKLDKLIHIVLENISHSYPKRELIITNLNVADINIKGEFYTHFADLFRIFLDNALKHSDQSIDRIDVDIVGKQHENILILSIRNAHSDSQKTVKENLPSNLQANPRKLSTEGKSGFPKAHKIIKSDLKNETNSCEWSHGEDKVFTVRLQISLDNLTA
ncbi:tetratricopeptide repeat protein [Chryseolinea lacunae]|uniref:ATP-binding protein n=1 Tax=Chryseolinea lacunae TaxID=2801331 RepID=A0ABS1KNL9_9BACT|nr:hypothetical protein [Chryseolinea lacunae]MBL0741078.1 hypothetical protein [Chryseolinea lacunae]